MARRRKNRIIRSLKNTYIIIVDGETEQWYFNAVKAAHQSLPFNVKPDLLAKKSLIKQAKYVQEKIDEGYGKVYWLVDLDQILHQNQHSFRREAKRLKRNNGDKIEILVNNPCLELWLLLHFEQTGRIFSNCEETTSHLKRHLPRYEKTKKYYLLKNPDIYEELREKTSVAVTNAKRLGDFDWDNPERSVAEIYKLIEKLLIQ